MKRIVLGILLGFSLSSWAGPRLLMHTVAGDILLELSPEVAPRHTEQILKLVLNGVYDGVHFHRAEPGFVLQLANASDRLIPLNAIQKSLIQKIPAEFSGLKHERGVLSMARYDDDVNSATTSFSILLGDAPHLDGKYTIFGRVIVGMDVVDALVGVPRDSQGKPRMRLGVSYTELVDPSKATRDLAMTPAVSLGKGVEVVARESILKSGLNGILQATLGLLFLLCLVGIALPSHLSTRPLWLIAATVCGFPGLCVALSYGHHSPWIGLGVFLALITYFKTMSGFEWARSKAPGGKN